MVEILLDTTLFKFLTLWKVKSIKSERSRTEKDIGKEESFLSMFLVTVRHNHIGCRKHLVLVVGN